MNRDEAITFNQQVTERFRAQQGTGPLGDPLPFDADGLLLLTHTGAKSGTRRTNPLGYLYLDDDRLFIVASFMGAPTNPDWYHNVVANPEVTVELGDETLEARAFVPQGGEYEALFREAVEKWPFLAEHQAKAGRAIPLVELRRQT